MNKSEQRWVFGGACLGCLIVIALAHYVVPRVGMSDVQLLAAAILTITGAAVCTVADEAIGRVKAFQGDFTKTIKALRRTQTFVFCFICLFDVVQVRAGISNEHV